MIKVTGIVPINRRYKNMLSTYDLCKLMGWKIPSDVKKFFHMEEHEYEPPRDGMEYDLSQFTNKSEFKEGEMYEINIAKIDIEIRTIRIVVK